MSADLQATETEADSELHQPEQATASVDREIEEGNAGDGHREAVEEEDGGNDGEEDENDDDDDDEEEEEEPKLKYAILTGNLANVYRGGDSTSSFVVAGDKMVIGTHNGSIHVLELPTAQSLRTYRAHQASVTSISISPIPPAPRAVKATDGSISYPPAPAPGRPPAAPKSVSTAGSKQQARAHAAVVPNTANNQIYIATSSLDGHVCISSLINPEDVQLRNFARPVNAVALSPDYKADRTYLSGGLAGNLIMTMGGRAGVSSDANTNSAAAAASGWLGSLGLGSNTGQDKILHSGEGPISSIQWSLSGKWVAWVNEEGIKIMRSHLKLGSEDLEDAWKRIAHAARPNRTGWDDMVGVWKARCQWINYQDLEADDIDRASSNGISKTNGHDAAAKPTAVSGGKNKVETLVVGWGDTAWILHVTSVPSASTTARASQRRQVGSADIVHKLQFRDCIISGITFYTPSLLAILAYRTKDDDDKPVNATKQQPAHKGRRQRQNGLAPQLRLVNVSDGEEVEVDEIPMSRHEILSAQDYHLGALYIPPPLTASANPNQPRGMLEGMFDAAGGRYATRIFTSSASILSGGSGSRDANGRAHSSMSPRMATGNDVTASPEPRRRPAQAHPHMLEPGLKLFIQSPYGCVLAVKQDLSDHLQWLINHSQYAQAWQMIDSHPEAVDVSAIDESSLNSRTTSPTRATEARQSDTLADFLADDSSSQTGMSASRSQNAAVHREKQRVGDLWLQQLVSAGQWEAAGQVAGKILGTSSGWQHWILTFAEAGRFDEITPQIPSTALKPPVPSAVYELILGHYINQATRLSALLDEWDLDMFEVRSIIHAIVDRLERGEVRQASVEDGVRGRDWRILLDALAKLYIADGRSREALRCYIQLQDADHAFALIRDGEMLDAAAEDVPGLVMLRVNQDHVASAPLEDLEAASSEAIQLLADEAFRGAISSREIIQQMERRGKDFDPFLFFYLRALWNGHGGSNNSVVPRGMFAARVEEGHTLVDECANRAVELFAAYDRELLLTFLRASSLYDYERAAEICERLDYIPELVYILSKTGQTRRALSLIIGTLGNVKQAIEFAKENPDLWDDLLEYSMNRPPFIRGLLEEVGAAAAFDPIEVVRRIPEGLEIQGLKQGIQKLVREFEVQYSISTGVAKVLRGEVQLGIDTLRAGRKKGVRFEVIHETPENIDLAVRDVPTQIPGGEALPVSKRKAEVEVAEKAKPGHCVQCGAIFHEHEKQALIGFACGHVYHLSCLLAANPETKDSPGAQLLLDQLNSSSAAEEDDSYVSSRPSIGGKVAHAHSIRNILRGGCQHCIVPEGA